jgi:alkylation response protein AidB-like acyl-CoA dehydrogenase
MMADSVLQGTSSATFLTLTPDELAVQSAAAEFLGTAVALDRLHSPHSADLSGAGRQEFASLGWFSLALPESAGGSGLSPVEHALFFRECGRECGPLDVLAQSLATQAAIHLETLRSSFSSGDEGVVFAIPDGRKWRLLGTPAARFALSVERDGAALFDLTQAQADIESRPSLDPSTTLRVLETLPGKALVVSPGPRIWQMGQLGAAAMLVGIAERALALIVEYAKVRETFGRKIGSYQAVRHPCADMELRAEAARSQLWYAAAALKENRLDAAAHLDAAKHIANESALTNADVSIQLHGGIGITDGHHAHLLLKRALLLGRIFGCKRALLRRLLHAELLD